MFYSSLPPSIGSATYQRKLIAYTTTADENFPNPTPILANLTSWLKGKVSLHPDGLSICRDHQGVKKRYKKYIRSTESSLRPLNLNGGPFIFTSNNFVYKTFIILFYIKNFITFNTMFTSIFLVLKLELDVYT